MLRIRRVGSYSIARYPQAEFRPWKRSRAAALAQSGAVSAALLLILESCDDGVGTVGPPPIEPEFLTENEARAVITSVFSGNGIQLATDVPMSLVDSHGDSVDVVLDGYSDSLRVGYEYITVEGDSTFTPELIAGIETANAGSGPYVGVALPEQYEVLLEQFTQAFIDTLKAQGKI